MQNEICSEQHRTVLPRIKRGRSGPSERGKLEIGWYFAARIEPGEYKAYSRSAKVYRDGKFKRWVLAVQFEIEATDTQATWYLNLGSGERPRAGRRSNFWQAWVAANNGPPKRNDRLSPRIFEKRWASVLIEDTAKDFQQKPVASADSYSVVRAVTEWQTGGLLR
jgi:hypothetical protein